MSEVPRTDFGPTLELRVMASKMFYTLDETARKLGMSESDVRSLAASGQLEELRQDDQPVYKASQVDLLAGTDDVLPLADSGELEPIGLGGSNAGLGSGDSREQTGISIFDPEETEDADPSAQTQVVSSPNTPGFDIDAAASGSGLYDLGGADDTSIGAGLLDDVYSDSGNTGSTAASATMSDSQFADPAGNLFEDTTPVSNEPTMAVGQAQVEVYDGPGSGWVLGLTFGVAMLMLAVLGVLIFAVTGTDVSAVMGGMADQAHYIIPGIGALVMLVGAVIGFVALRRS